ncbi:MATE family efflux transporter [Paludisphaera mucosa]|uniref:Multidrug-efflux transporter n=1 Tax=Paludisphaera mucosa TaxID=3030827 RepID=A0ABT6FBE1_9BACT|nr:MATE family efflux transporter [Paludisphaera mucosa]MDG3004913.1 MATE family efflux transporter [Paludisphaera mucosa]
MDRLQRDLLRQGMRLELGPMLRLAGPVVSAELGWMAMGIVDTIFVGRLGAEAIGAVSLGNALYFAVAIFGMGLLLGLDALVSQAYGAGDLHECHDWLVQGMYLAAMLCPPAMLLLWVVEPLSDRMGLNAAVLEQAKPFLRAMTWGTPALFIYATFRRYLQGMGLVKPVMAALLSANVVNALMDWVFVYGKLGFPAMGVEGSGWATTISRWYMAGFLVVFALWNDARSGSGLIRTRLAPRLAAIRRLFGIGLPAAMHLLLEVGVFALATTLAGKLDATSLAAHHVVLDVASVTFMIPLGLATAGAIRVGQAIGRGEPSAAGRAGWTALALGAAFMTTSGLVMVAFPRPLAALFTDDAGVIAAASRLMLLAAAFQLFDGLQGVATGALRGAGDTRTAMICTLICYWFVGLPLGWFLCFREGRGVFGLWIGLALGLFIAGLTLLFAWRRKAAALGRGEFAMVGAGVGH